MRPPSAAQSRAGAVAPTPRGFPVVACPDSIARDTRCLLLTHTSINAPSRSTRSRRRECSSSATKVEPRFRRAFGGSRNRGAIPVLGTFEVPQTWSEKHQQRQFGGPNRARSNLQNSSPRSYCSLIGCLGRPVAPQPGRGVLSLGVVPPSQQEPNVTLT